MGSKSKKGKQLGQKKGKQLGNGKLGHEEDAVFRKKLKPLKRYLNMLNYKTSPAKNIANIRQSFQDI